jgi:uncharacterized membrane protein YcaP (DUF421 family)
MFPGAHALAAIFVRTAVIYVVVLTGVRLSGKREVGQMTPFDLTLLLLLSNAVQNAMTGPDTSLLGGVVAAATLLVMNYFVAEVSGGNRRFRKFVQGQPSLLVHDGEGIASCHDVALAVLEVDGSISCLKYDDLNPNANNHLAQRRKILQKHQ